MLCDVILVANGVDIFAHRVILAGCSPYFQAMLTNFAEKTQERIEIKEIDAIALELIVEYVYTAEILITEENFQVSTHCCAILQSCKNRVTINFMN